MVNKSFIVIILTIVILGVIFYLLGNCSREGFQGNNSDKPVRFFADVDTGDDYDNDFMSTNITKIKNIHPLTKMMGLILDTHWMETL